MTGLGSARARSRRRCPHTDLLIALENALLIVKEAQINNNTNKNVAGVLGIHARLTLRA